MGTNKERSFVNTNGEKEMMNLAKKFIFEFFIINDEGILIPRPVPHISFYTSVVFHNRWFSIISDLEFRKFLLSALPCKPTGELNEIYDDENLLNQTIEVLKKSLDKQLVKLGVKNPYIISNDYSLIVTIPDTSNELTERIPSYSDKGFYKPVPDKGNVFGVRVGNKFIKYRSLILFNSFSDAKKFHDQVKTFYHLVNSNAELSIEYFDLNNYYKPMVIFNNQFGFSNDQSLKDGVNIEIDNSISEYYFQDNKIFSIVTTNYSLEFMNDVFHYSSFGSEYYPGKLLTKIIKETKFDFTNVKVEQDSNGVWLYLIRFKNEIDDNIDFNIDIEIDDFMDVYYFNTLAKNRTKFIAVDIWDLAKKYYEYVVQYSDLCVYISEPKYFNIGVVYYYLEEYLNRSKNLRIIKNYSDGYKQLVVSDVMGGMHFPVELQVFDNDDSNILISNVDTFDPEDKLFEEKAVFLHNTYRKNKFMKIRNDQCIIDPAINDGEYFYTHAMAVIVGVDEISMWKLSKSFIERLNEELVLVLADGTLTKPFKDGSPLCLFFEFRLSSIRPSDDLVYISSDRNAYITEGSKVMFVDRISRDRELKLTKVYRPEDLPRSDRLYDDIF